MARTISSLPEELTLRVFNSLEHLNDLYAVMLTCKQFNRITLDITAKKISQLALATGNYFPTLQPVNHFLLVASARRLSEWAREAEERQMQLKRTMHGGVTELAALAMEVAPICLKDIREVWAWKRDTVVPLSKSFDITCGPLSRDECNLTVCDDTELALFAWAIYGELFDHVLCLDWLDSPAKLDSVTRFKFIIYCVPDVNSFNYMSLKAPPWFTELEAVGEKFQQLSLMHAMLDGLGHQSFEADIWQLMNLEMPSVYQDRYPDPDLGMCNEAQHFIQIVQNSGRKSLDVIRLAHMARLGQESNPAAIIAWLEDTWTLVQQNKSSSAHETPKLTHTGDQWLKNHVLSMDHDLQFTLWNNLQYQFPTDSSTSEEDAATALHNAVIS